MLQFRPVAGLRDWHLNILCESRKSPGDCSPTSWCLSASSTPLRPAMQGSISIDVGPLSVSAMESPEVVCIELTVVPE